MQLNPETGVRVCLAYPSPEYIHHKFITSFIQTLIYHSSKINLTMANTVSSRIAFNRNKLVQQARENNATHILFIDADMVIPVNGLERLLNHDKEIVCATAAGRVSEDSLAGKMHGCPVDPLDQTPNKKLVEMSLVGLPFMLIDMKVFDKIPKPYFAEPERNEDIVAEDQYFCEKARAAGFSIWCDTELSMEMGHVGSHVYKITPAV